MLPSGSRILCMISHTFAGLDLHCADHARPFITAGGELDYIFVDRYIIICLSEV